MNKNKIFSTILFLFTLVSFFNFNTTHAIYKKDVPKLLNEILLKTDIEKKKKLLNNLKVINFINKLPNLFLNQYVYSNINLTKFNNYKILKDKNNKDNLVFELNKYNLLNNSLYLDKKEQIRSFIIQELAHRQLLKLDTDIQSFYIDTNLKGELYVKKENESENKKDLISEYIDNILQEEKNKLKVINSIYKNKNIYYNYLFDNNVKGLIVKPIDFKYLSESIIIRNENDFYKLFKVTSYRYRSGYAYDPGYRKYNIAQIYNTIKGNKIVLYPEQTISFNQIYLKDDNGTKFQKGSAIVKGEVDKEIYGGGVCGAATGMYQGVLYNKQIETNARNHSIWYNMYRSSINGEKIYTPGLDATYFTNVIDFKMKNIGKYPIILVNRVVNNIEENFSLSMKFETNDKRKPIEFVKRTENCFSWIIDGKYKRSCYQKIASEEKAKEEAAKKEKEKNLAETEN